MRHSDKTGQDRRRHYAIALLLLPVLVLWRQDDPLYTPLWQTDPWFYMGYFHNLVNFKRDLFPGFYYGSRLSWILPGFLLNRLFSPLAANAILHLGVHSVAALSLFAALRKPLGLRVAYLVAMIFSLHPWFWAATGWDHVNGGAIAYFLLAMALLTRAAEEPGRKWSLLFAGMAMAGAVHAHLFVLALTPLLALQYLALSWTWHGAPVLRSARTVCLWSGIGFVAVTAPICAINGLLVDGNFWFWTPSLHTAQAVTSNYIWTESLWYQHMLVPYLWFILVAVVAALLLLPTGWKQARAQRNVALLLFSLQLLLATALMVFLQSRGVTLLGHYYYACYLFPFVFPVLGASFCATVDGMPARVWMATCCGATLLFALPWIDPPANPFLARVMPEWAAFALTSGVLFAALLLRTRGYGAWLALFGLGILTSLTYSGSYRWVNIHGTRQEYSRILDSRRRIEEERNGAPIRFWYDRTEPAFFEYYALNAGYLAEFARVGEGFPEGCKMQVSRGEWVVVTSDKPRTPDLALRALADCWRGSGLTPAMQASWQVEKPGRPYTAVVLKAVDDVALFRPLRIEFDGTGTGHIELTENITEPLSLPLERWTTAEGATVQNISGDLLLRTPKAASAYAFTYAPLVVPSAGRYTFQLKGKPQTGRIAFGAFPGDQSKWLATDLFGRRTPTGYEMSISVDLKKGEIVILRIANNVAREEISTFLLESVTVTTPR